MASVRLTDSARSDLQAVYRYSYDNYGERQADLYFGALRGACYMLASYPVFGRRTDGVSQMVRRFHFRDHLIVYRALEAGVLVVRVLHGSLDGRR